METKGLGFKFILSYIVSSKTAWVKDNLSKNINKTKKIRTNKSTKP